MNFSLTSNAATGIAYDPYWDDTSLASRFRASASTGSAEDQVDFTPLCPGGVGSKKTLIRQYVTDSVFSSSFTATPLHGHEPTRYYLGYFGWMIRAAVDIESRFTHLGVFVETRAAIVASDLSNIRRCKGNSGSKILTLDLKPDAHWRKATSWFWNTLSDTSPNWVSINAGDRIVFEVGVFVQQTNEDTIPDPTVTMYFGAPYGSYATQSDYLAANSLLKNPSVSMDTTVAYIALGPSINQFTYTRPFSPTHSADRVMFPSVAAAGEPLNDGAFNS